MPWDKNGMYVYTAGPTISGFLWLVTGPSGKEYYYYTSTEDYPELPEGHYAEPIGGGLINVAVLDNATIKDGIVTISYAVPDEGKFIDTLVYILQQLENWKAAARTLPASHPTMGSTRLGTLMALHNISLPHPAILSRHAFCPHIVHTRRDIMHLGAAERFIRKASPHG